MAKKLSYINPKTGLALRLVVAGSETYLMDSSGKKFPFKDSILRISSAKNYSDSFGFQWELFSTTQIDKVNNSSNSEKRLFAETGWKSENLNNLHILEAGCGAGRFTDVLLRKTNAFIYSIDYSSAIEVARSNNKDFLDRVCFAQASILEIPFPKNSFDKILCLGVLQHTHSVKQSISSLVQHVKLNGEVVVDFYQVRGWYTWIHAKYLFRFVTSRMPPKLLLAIIRKNIRWMLLVFDLLCLLKLGFLTRFLPIADVRGLPRHINQARRIELTVLDTFDALSPRYDKPQKIVDVVSHFKANGCLITFAGVIDNDGSRAAVVRAKKVAYIRE